MKKIVLLGSVFFCCLQLNQAQPGELDPSFGNNGIVRADFGESVINTGSGQKVLVQSDGKIYLIINQGDATVISRRHSDGSRDLTYGEQGFSDPVIINSNDAAFDGNGKIVVAGSSNAGFAVARYNTNGTLDKSFSDDGMQTTYFSVYGDFGNSLAIQNDGKIVVVGGTHDAYTTEGEQIHFALARYNTDGSLDPTFSQDGKKIDSFGHERESTNSVAIQSDGKIIVTGELAGYGYINGHLARYNKDGTRDTAFKVPYYSSIEIQNDGKIIVAGSPHVNFGIARYNADASIDSSFSGDGIQTTEFPPPGPWADYSVSFALSLSIQPDGKIVTVGGSGDSYDFGFQDFAIARYNIDGRPDSSFSDDGKHVIDISDVCRANSVAIQSDGKIIMIGNLYEFCDRGLHCLLNFTSARLNTDGTLDNTFNGSGILTDKWPKTDTYFSSIAVQKDGKIIALGSNMARYNTDGSLDPSFSDDGVQDTRGSFIETQSNGKSVVLNSNTISRYHFDGSFDTTFNHTGVRSVNFGFERIAKSFAIQSDGKIVVVGGDDFFIARYNADGTIDQTFAGTGKRGADFTSYAMSVAIQPDGKIVVVGDDFSLARYNTNGTLDKTFSDDGKQTIDFGSGPVYASSLRIKSDGKIVVAGNTSINGNNNLAIAVYNIDGSPDSSFSGDGKQNNNLINIENNNGALTIQPDGKLLLGGHSITNVGDNNFALVRYNTNGNLDSAFNGDGIQTTKVSSAGSSITSIAFANNKLYASGVGADTLGIGNKGILARYFLEDEKNTLPIISLTTPADDSTYTAYGYIKVILNADASDADGTISKVEFYNGSTLLHTELVAPYGYIWHHVTAGNYTITAKATDNDDNVTTSDAVHISVVPDVAPTVKITSPANGGSYRAYSNIILSADANDVDGTVKKVDFYNGSTLIFTENVAPFKRGGYRLPLGNYSITAKATDNNGRVTISQPVAISVVSNLAPVVTITSPANNTTYVSPATIILSADASDVDGTIKKVEFYNGSILLVTENDAPYFRSWPDVSEGNYSITAVATDNEGKITASAPIAISVIAASRSLVKEDRLNSSKEPLSLSLNPNPVASILNISVHGLSSNSGSTISVLSVSGAVIKTVQQGTLNKNVQLDVSSLSDGVYFIKVINGNKILYKQFVKL